MRTITIICKLYHAIIMQANCSFLPGSRVMFPFSLYCREYSVIFSAESTRIISYLAINCSKVTDFLHWLIQYYQL